MRPTPSNTIIINNESIVLIEATIILDSSSCPWHRTPNRTYAGQPTIQYLKKKNKTIVDEYNHEVPTIVFCLSVCSVCISVRMHIH